MRLPIIRVPLLVWMLLATVLLLSGCSMVWLLPVHGTMALALAIAIGAGAGWVRSQNASHPESAPAGLTAEVTAESGMTRRQAPAAAWEYAAATSGDGWHSEMAIESNNSTMEPTLMGGDGLGDVPLHMWLADRDKNFEPNVWIFDPIGGVTNSNNGAALPSLLPPIIDGGEGVLTGDGLVDILTAQQVETSDYRVYGHGSPVPPSANSWAPAVWDALQIHGDGFGASVGAMTVADGKRINPMHGNPEAIKKGGVTFNTRCGTYCHGGRAIGGGCPSLIDESWIHGESDLDIYRVIVGGAPDTRMGAFGATLTADQIWEIIAYLRNRQREYFLEKAGPNSLRAQSIDCPTEAVVTIHTVRNRDFVGVLIIEDEKSYTVEDRSGRYPARYRVKKERVDTASVQCIEEFEAASQK